MSGMPLRLLVSLTALVLLLAGCSSGSDIRSITILHLNDLHARLLPDERGRGGFAHVASAVAQEKKNSPGALLLHGGDFVQGSPVSSLFRGMPVIEIANHMGFDVHTLGNHEFDYGWQRTREFVAAGEFATVSANVLNEAGELLTPEPYVIREINGVKVGVIGMVTERLADLTRAELRGPWHAAPVVETVRRYAQELEPQVDLIVMLAHCFNDEDDRVLAEVPEVGLVVGGHNHGGHGDIKEVDGRLGVKVRAWGRELGRLDLKYDRLAKKTVGYDWRAIPVNATSYPADPEVEKLVAHWEGQVSELVDVPIGRADRTLGKRDLQPMIEQVMREAVGADLAHMNAGGIRAALPQGELLKRHVWNVLPFGNLLAYGRLRGSELPRELRSQPGIEPNREYVVATNDFTAEKWAEGGILLAERAGLVRDAMIAWIERAQRLP